MSQTPKNENPDAAPEVRSTTLVEKAIPVRTRRRVMDWSLVLLSQHIECRIHRDDRGWYLMVPTEAYPQACAVLRQYQRENRLWVWRPKVRDATVAFHAGAVLWCLLMAFFFSWAGSAESGPRAHGILSTASVLDGQWWRLFTAITLHHDLAHLAANLGFGLLLLGLSMGRCGGGAALLTAWLAGAVGNVASLALHGQAHRSLGASGMVMGALGVLAAASFRDYRSGQLTGRQLARGLLGGVLLFVLLGFAPGSDVVAHFGGFVGGLGLGLGLTFVPESFLRNSWTDWLCGLILAVGIVIPWALALTAQPGLSP
jgi:membrane associated rhomboid family serine protease